MGSGKLGIRNETKTTTSTKTLNPVNYVQQIEKTVIVFQTRSQTFSAQLDKTIDGCMDAMREISY